MNYSELLDAVISVNKQNRAGNLTLRGVPDYRGMSRVQYAAEFCTVRLDIGQGVGKTKYIADHARPWDVVVVPNTIWFRDGLLGHALDRNIPIVTGEELDRAERWRGRNAEVPRMVYVDEPSRLTPRQLDTLYYTFAHHPDQTFVLLG